MYDRSVWLEEVDKALVDLITSTLTYIDGEGNTKSIVPSFPLNSTDFNELSLPTVVIKHLGQQFDMYRYDSNHTQIVTSYDMDKSTMTFEESAKPYTLNYQLEFITEYKEDMNRMLKYWQNFIPKRYMLPVTDCEGGKRECYMLLVKPPVTLDQQKGDIKIYRTVFVYDIKVELDMGVANTTNIVKGINLGIN